MILSGKGAFRKMRTALCAAALFITANFSSSIAVTNTLNGSITYQTIRGFGTGIGTWYYNDNSYLRALDTLIAYGMNYFRIGMDEYAFEATNDNSDPFVQNWTYYDAIFSSPYFEKTWKTIKYLNDKGITGDHIMLEFYGRMPTWMSSNNQVTIANRKELAEYEAAAVKYGLSRRSPTVSFKTYGPLCEYESNGTEGPWFSDYDEMGKFLDTLVIMMDNMGIPSDVSISTCSRDEVNTSLSGTLRSHAKCMTRMKQFDSHQYTAWSPLTFDHYSEIKNSNYPDMEYWVTEQNKWCSDCDFGGHITYTMDDVFGVSNFTIIDQNFGSSLQLLFDGLDTWYFHPPAAFSGWGMLSIDTTTWQYTKVPLYLGSASLWARFMLPQAKRIQASAANNVGYYNSSSGQISTIGMNNSSSTQSYTLTLQNLPTISSMEWWVVDNQHPYPYLKQTVAVTGQSFTVTLPARCLYAFYSGGSTTPAKALTPEKSSLMAPWTITKSRSATMMRFAAPPDCGGIPVRIRICDARGHMVRTLLNGSISPGLHAVTFDGSDDHGNPLGTGIFFCTLSTPETRSTITMLGGKP